MRHETKRRKVRLTGIPLITNTKLKAAMTREIILQALKTVFVLLELK